MLAMTGYIVVLMLQFSSAMAQTTTIKGKVLGYDENGKSSPLKNARVVAMPSNNGTLTSNKGEFSINVSATDINLIVSYAGYIADTISINSISNKSNLQIQLKNIQLSDIEVGGSKMAGTLSFSEGVRTETITTRGLCKAACCNLAESFTTTPSVDVQYSDAVTGAKRIQLLGLQSVYSQIQQENMPIMRGLAANYGFAFVPGQ
jgi:hypothetical protein